MELRVTFGVSPRLKETEKGAWFCFLCAIMHRSNLPAAAHEKQEANGQESPGKGERGSNSSFLFLSVLKVLSSGTGWEIWQAGRLDIC